MASFYDSASIITIPSGYKAGTLYSAKPTDGTGDMTFTRTGDTATRVNSAGIIERCITNLALQSNNFSSASWIKSNVNIGTGITDPNGGITAFSFGGTSSTSNVKNITQGTLPGTQEIKTITIYAKANTHSFLQLRFSASNFHVNFDLSNGTFSAGSSAVGSMTSIGNGWYRCQLTSSVTTSGVVIGYQLVDSLTAITNESSTTTNSVYIWRAQGQLGDFATNYIDTATTPVTQGPVTNLPRLDYFGSTCPQLLMEPTRTNLAVYSMAIAAAYSPTGVSLTDNVTTSPDGYTNADVMIEDSSNNVHRISRTVSFVSGTTYAFSTFAKIGTGSRRLQLGFLAAAFGSNHAVNFNLQTGLVTPSSSGVTGKIENYGNGWYRCTIVATATVTTNSNHQTFLRNSDVPSTATYTGDGTSSMFIWGQQVEAGAYATSFIPTFVATVTRNQDICTDTGISSLIGQVEGTMFIDINYIRPTSDANGRLLILRDANENVNAINALIFPNNQFQLTVAFGGGATPVIPFGSSTTIPFGRNKIAIAYNDGSYAVYRNGSLFASVNNTFKPLATLTSLDVGNSVQFTRSLANPINQVLIFKTRLTNEELATLTTL